MVDVPVMCDGVLINSMLQMLVDRSYNYLAKSCNYEKIGSEGRAGDTLYSNRVLIYPTFFPNRISIPLQRIPNILACWLMKALNKNQSGISIASHNDQTDLCFILL